MPCAWCSAGLDITCFIVGVVTSLQAGVFGVWFLAGGRTVFFSPKSHLLFSGYQVSSPGTKLATHLRLVPRFRISRAVPLLLLCTFVVWSWVYCGTWVFYHSVYNSSVLNGTQSRHHPVHIRVHSLSKTSFSRSLVYILHILFNSPHLCSMSFMSLVVTFTQML